MFAMIVALSVAAPPETVPIPAGAFRMGSADAPPTSRSEWVGREFDEFPAHDVKLSAFRIGKFEVTHQQFEAFDPTHQRWPTDAPDNAPVTFVTWDEAQAYCAWLAKTTGKPYRLPTEAEWEYACRAGTTTRFATGDTLDAKQANIAGERPVAGGQYPANAWGVHDMHGNVAEWCLDGYGPYAAEASSDPVGSVNASIRVVRGWSFLKAPGRADVAFYARSANRSGHVPSDRNRATGFRVVEAPLPLTKPLALPIPLHARDVRQTPTMLPTVKEPVYRNYADARPTIPKTAFGPLYTSHNHYAALVECPNGDLLAAWYTCVQEPGREVAQAASRLRAGAEKWEPAEPFWDVPDVNDHAPVLLRDGKRIWHFCTQSLVGFDDSTNIARYSDDNGATWSVPTIMLERQAANALSQPCSAIRTKDAILVACDGDKHRDERILRSCDDGKTWQVAKGDMRATVGKYAIHPAIAPTTDGLICFLRGPQPMPILRSTDAGDTWTVQPSTLPGIGSTRKPSAVRLASGALLLISHDWGAFVALSDDDGKTWPHKHKIPDVERYMSAVQGSNGMIHVFGSGMSCVSFNEAWVRR